MDKKTSVLDYVVKSLYDKQEESVLSVLQDLNLVEDCAKLSGAEVLREYSTLRGALDGLQEAYTFNGNKLKNSNINGNGADASTTGNSSNTSGGNEVFTSPTAKKMIDSFSARLEAHLSQFQGMMAECERSRLILQRKVDDIIRYFGEDVVAGAGGGGAGAGNNNANASGNSASGADTSKIFGVLQEFLRAVAFSKAAVEWRLYRSNSSG